jgi:hypothetical protein
MRESRPYGSVRGARGETRVPTATRALLRCMSPLLGHKAVFPTSPINVRCWGKSGQHVLALSLSAYDPGPDIDPDHLTRCAGGHPTTFQGAIVRRYDA